MNTKIKLPLRSISIEQAIINISQGAQLITASPMLTAEWKYRYLNSQQTPTCETPAIFSWSVWLSEHYRQCSNAVCLNPLQEKLLWEKIISEDLPHLTSATIRGLGKHASSAYLLMQQYQIDPAELAYHGEEASALKRWIEALHTTLNQDPFKQRGLASFIPQIISQNIKTLDLPQHIILDGFELFSPIQQQILCSLEQYGVKLSVVKDKPNQAQTSLTTYPDENTEFQQVSQRVANVLSKNKHARIAIVSTATLANHDLLQRHMNQALISKKITNPSPDKQAITMPARKLSDSPMIGQLLHILSLAAETSITFEDFTTLIFSPWTRNFDAESMQRAKLDALFRRQNRHRLSFKGLLQSSQVQTLPALHHIIKSLSSWRTAQRPSQQWIKDVQTLLQQIGFMQTGLEHETLRSNIEIRQMNAFRDALTSLIAVDVFEKDLSWTQYLSLLRSACSESNLSLPAKHPNVVVMPLHHMPGLRFDHVFLLGMDESNFPPPAQAQALLPIRLQQKHQLPMSHAAITFESSQWLWDQLQQSAPNIDISYTQQRDEHDMLPSSFVSKLTAQKPVIDELTSPQWALETFDDVVNTAVLKNESIHGGTNIIRNQSACPFRAFANHRLGITSLDETAPGIEATTKGSLIHLALEFIWKQLKSQSALLALDTNKINELINSAIEHAWLENKSSPDFITQGFEKKRMHKILQAWLTLEATRPAFDVIATEKRYALQLPEHQKQQFSINITADRMDKDTAGHHILLDYKTGAKQSTSKWLGERMEEPQLPLYAIAAGLSAHDAIAFALVRSGDDMGFEGLTGDDMDIKGLTICDGKRNHPEDWQDVLTAWKIQINALALEFMDGRSDVDPRNSKACLHCGLEAVCRIEETGFSINTEEDS